MSKLRLKQYVRAVNSGPDKLSAMKISAFIILTTCFGIQAVRPVLAQQTQLSASQPATPSPAAASAPASITLEEAIARAKANEPAFASAVAADKVASLNHSLARSAL